MRNILAGTFLLVLLTGCNTPEKLLCRNWRLVDVEFNENEYQLTAEQKPQMIQQLRDSCLFVFNKNHTYSFKLPQRIETGVWEFSRKKDTIYTRMEHGGSTSKINVLSKIALDVDSYTGNAGKIHYVLAPLETK